MEGLEATVVEYSDWRQDNDALRLDSEYQLKAHRAAIELVCTFGALQFKDDAPEIIHPHEIIREYVEEDGVWFLRAQNVRPMQIDPRNKVMISEADADKLLRNVVKREDVLVTRTGANRGQCAFFDRDERAIASSHTFIIRPKTIDPEFLTLFLNTAHGVAQIDKGVFGAAQPEVAPYYLGNIWVPKISPALMTRLKTAFSNSKAQAAKAEVGIGEAETVLLAALGLANWTPPEPLAYTARASDVYVSGRFDARFFAPRIQALLDLLAVDGRTIADVAAPRREKFRPDACASFDYIEISDIDGAGAAASTRLASEDAPSRATWHVRAGDILTSTVRPIRRLSAQITPEQEGFVCSSGFVVVMPRDIAPEVLLTYLRLPVICELLDLFASASMYPAITDADIFNLPLPHIADAVTDQVTQNVIAAKAAKARAARMLEAAKRAVEIAIENGEPAAMAYLDQVEGAI